MAEAGFKKLSELYQHFDGKENPIFVVHYLDIEGNEFDSYTYNE